MRAPFIITAVLFTATVFMPAVSSSATIVVPDDYATIQAAIDAAMNGDSVIVKPGTYGENIDFKGKTITVISSNGPDVTVIDGGQVGTVVTFQSGEGNDTVLDGFKVTNGESDSGGGGIYCAGSSPSITNNIITGNYAFLIGGGIHCHVASPNIIGNQILSNTVTYYDGGGIACEASSPLIKDNFINGNIGLNCGGGGIFCTSSSSPIILENTLIGNVAADEGGAIYCLGNNCSPTIENNTISYNFAVTGGGIYCKGGIVTITNNFIIGNEGWSSPSSLGGGGIHCRGTAIISNNIISGNISGDYGGGVLCSKLYGTILNNTITNNSAQHAGGGVYIEYHSTLTIRNSILWDNMASGGIGQELVIVDENNPSTVTINYSVLKGGLASVHIEPLCTLNWGPGMISTDPLFVSSVNNDFHLTYPSPCRDTGDNTAPYLPATDFEGDPRIAPGTVDMGADEFHSHLYLTGKASPGKPLTLKFIDLPGTTPVGFWIALNNLETPIPGKYGYWFLLPPMIGPFTLPPIPSNGVYKLPGILPLNPPGPYTLYLQAIMGTPLKLSNLCTMDIQ